MQVREKKFTVKSIIENTENGNITYDHPMQRKPGQWDKEQQSLLIHSILAGYAVPQTYGLQLYDNYDYAFSVLDGKQRFTTVYDFVHDEFSLVDDMPVVTIRKRHVITDDNGNKKAEFVKHEYDISNMKFSELDETLQDIIKDFPFTVMLLSDCTDEDIENQFFRLNNGTPLTKDQKTRVILGDELAQFLDTQEQTEFFTKKAYFTNNQRKHGEVQTCILQTLMLIMDYSYKDLSNNAVMDFAEWFRKNHKPSDLEYCADIFLKLNKAVPESKKPHKLMKKTNIPILAYHIQTADEIGMEMDEYGKKIQDLFDSYDTGGEYFQDYCGAGSYKKDKVDARLAYFERMLRGEGRE